MVKDQKQLFPKQVRVYELVNPDLLKGYEQEIKSVFTDVLEGQGTLFGNSTFVINEYCGWITYAKEDLFSKQNNPPLLAPSGELAGAAAKEFMLDLNKALANTKAYPFLISLNSVSLVPLETKVIDIQLVQHPEFGFFDHWLVRLAPYLVLSNESNQRVQVLGSQIDIRIGEHNSILSYSAKWSPLGLRRISKDLFPLETILKTNEEDHSHTSAHSAYELVYLQENYHKAFTAPYYFGLEGGHHGGLIPACSYSLFTGFTKALILGEIQLSAFVLGGSGNYQFEWYGWQPDNIFISQGLVHFGFSLVANTPLGVWNVILIVRDVQLGIVSEYQEMVYSSTLTQKEETYA
jgi:hypothetical protein